MRYVSWVYLLVVVVFNVFVTVFAMLCAALNIFCARDKTINNGFTVVETSEKYNSYRAYFTIKQ